MAPKPISSPVESTAAADIAGLNSIAYTAPLTCPAPSRGSSYVAFLKGFQRKHNTLVPVNLVGRTVIITGSNSGIGRAAALRFSAWGANVILACRDPPAHELHPRNVREECRRSADEAGHTESEIDWWELDCSRLASVDAFCQRWLDKDRPLDLLCNNAGIATCPGGVAATEDGFHIIQQVNFLSAVLITLRLLPSLARAPAPRIVNTTSAAHLIGEYQLDNWRPGSWTSSHSNAASYGSSKLYNQCWLTELQHRLLQHGQYRHITVQGVHPGFVQTSILTAGQAPEFLMPLITPMLARLTISAELGSHCILHAATAVEAGSDTATSSAGLGNGRGGGRYWDQTFEAEPHVFARDRDARNRVWRKVAEDLGLASKGLLDILRIEAS